MPPAVLASARVAGRTGRPLHLSFTADSAAQPHVGFVPHREGIMTIRRRRTDGAESQDGSKRGHGRRGDRGAGGRPYLGDACGGWRGEDDRRPSTTDLLTAEGETDDASARNTLWENTPVRELMTPRLFTVAPDEDVREAARQMLYAEIHRLFVAEGDQVIGVISTTDIVRAVATGGL